MKKTAIYTLITGYVLLIGFLMADIIEMSEARVSMILGGSPTAAGCTIGRDQELTASNAYVDWGRNADSIYVCSKFEAVDTVTLCGGYISAEEYSGDGTATAVVSQLCIYTDDGGAGSDADPVAPIIGSCSDSVTMSTAAAWEDATEYDILFENMSAPVTDGTSYWICVYSSTLDGTNRIQFNTTDTDSTPAAVELIKKGDGIDAPMDTIATENRCFRYLLYSAS